MRFMYDVHFTLLNNLQLSNIAVSYSIVASIKRPGFAWPFSFNVTHWKRVVSETIEELRESFLQVAGDRRHFSSLDIRNENFQWFSKKANEMYNALPIKKKSGKMREVFQPHRQLKLYQKIIKELLEKKYTPIPCVFGVKGNSKQHSSIHIGCEYLIKIDIKNFFPSISKDKVKQLLQNQLGYSEEVSEIISRLCCKNYQLVQGSPCSPILANLIMSPVDLKLSELTKDLKSENNLLGHHFVYGRYADDMVISIHHNGEVPKSFCYKPLIEDICKKFSKIILDHGFRLTNSKFKIESRHQNQSVNGNTINVKNNVSRKYFKELRAQLHQLQFKSAMNAYPEIKVLEGKINYLEQTKGKSDPVCQKYRQQFTELKLKWSSELSEYDEFCDIYEELIRIHYRAHGFNNLDWVIWKFRQKQEYARQQLAHFVNSYDDSQKALESLPKFFYLWPNIRKAKFNRKGQRVKQAFFFRLVKFITSLFKNTSSSLNQIHSVYPSAFLLGNSFWRRVLKLEMEIGLSFNGNPIKKLKKHDKEIIKFLVKSAEKIRIDLSLSRHKDDTYWEILTTIAQTFEVSQVHAFAISHLKSVKDIKLSVEDLKRLKSNSITLSILAEEE